ncbi:hypothetical protein D1007_28779 [Hordeum vulgare]|nr:hypothetical protein D1007_28779 [Hordeum vulgare]
MAGSGEPPPQLICKKVLGLSPVVPDTVPSHVIDCGKLFLPSTGDGHVHLFIHKDAAAVESTMPSPILFLHLPGGGGGADITVKAIIVLERQREWTVIREFSPRVTEVDGVTEVVVFFGNRGRVVVQPS